MSEEITPKLLNEVLKNIMSQKEVPHMLIGNGAVIKKLCQESGIIPPIELKDDVVYQVNPDSWERK